MESENLLDTQWRKFGKWFAYSVLVVLFFYLYLYINVKYVSHRLFALPIYLIIIGITLTGHTIFLLHQSTFDFLKIYRFILFLFFIFITYICLVLYIMNPTIVILYIPITAMVLLLSNIKITALFSVAIIIFCNYLEDLSIYFGIGLPKNFYSSEAISVQQFLSIIISAYFTFLFMYFYSKMEKAKIEMKYKRNGVFLTNYELKPTDDNKDKYQKLYDAIIEAFKKDKIYRDPDFNIRKLAELLDTNTTYVSKAMNLDGNKNFNQLVNEYRINDVVNMMKSDNTRKYTIQYLYTQAGFSQQSTFNKIFKEYTRSTPSEYLEKLKNSKQTLKEEI